MSLMKIFLLLHLTFVLFRKFEVQASTIKEEIRMLVNKIEQLNEEIVVIKKAQVESCAATRNILAEDNHQLAATIHTLIKLNVGGREFETTVGTLTKINNTYFTSLLTQTNQVQLDDKGRIFIDRNGDLFSYILDYLRNGELSANHKWQRKSLAFEAHFYQLTRLSRDLSFFGEGTLLNPQQQNKLNEFYGIKNQEWKLIYKASKHGFAALTFHTLCNNKGPTMTVIMTQNGYLFGGFTKKTWESLQGRSWGVDDPTSFIFTLTNPYGIEATKFTIKDNGKNAIYVMPIYGPTFGFHYTEGHDIHISDNSNINTLSNTNFPQSYIDTTGKGNTLFAGVTHFTVSELEVYSLA